MGNTINTAQTFVTKENDGKCKWVINNDNDQKLLDKILNAKNGDEFFSNQCKIGKITWQMQLNPNGYNKKRLGSCDVCLKLLSMPDSWKEVTMTKSIKSIETYSSYTSMATYKTGEAGTWAAHTLSLEELKNGGYKQITFEIDIKLLSIKNKQNDTQILHSPNLRRHSEISWKFDAKSLTYLKQSKLGKEVHTDDIYDDIWSLYVYPNGFKGCEGKFTTGLKMSAALPAQINKVTARWNVKIPQYNISKTYENDFDHNKDPYWNSSTLLSFDDLKNMEVMDDITIKTTIDVKNVYDEVGKDITESYPFYMDDDEKTDAQSRSINKYHLKNMLVVIICVSEYDAGGNLPGTQKDLEELVSLFRDKYNYKVFATEKARVTYDDMALLLNKARTEFMENEYDGVIVCFSGHGNENALLCSDYNGKEGAFARADVCQWFDGKNCKSRIDKFKFYFLDACRGGQDTAAVEEDLGTKAKGNAQTKLKGALENSWYMYGNSNWTVTLEKQGLGGMLSAAVVKAFKSNLKALQAIGPMQDQIRKFARSFGNERGVVITPVETNIDYNIQGKITFGPN